MNKERLKNGLEKMGIAADETALDRFEAFHAILDEYNARMDLTAVLDEDERVDRHDLDSAAPLAHGLLMPGAKVIDVGTGAGFPGMPLLILRPDLQMTFLDALNKRILFLEDALARLGLKAETLHARAEDAAKMAAHREQYDAAVSRAVANAATLEGTGRGGRDDRRKARGFSAGRHGARHGGCADPRPGRLDARAAADG